MLRTLKLDSSLMWFSLPRGGSNNSLENLYIIQPLEGVPGCFLHTCLTHRLFTIIWIRKLIRPLIPSISFLDP